MKGYLTFAAKAAISALLLYLALRLIEVGPLLERLQRLQGGWIAASLALFAAQIVLVSLRWQRIAGLCGAPLGAPPAFAFTLIGTFFNQVLPSSVGGDVVRVWLLSRATGRWKAAVHATLVDRAVGLIWLAVIVLVCLPWSLRLFDNPVGRTALVLIGAGGVLGPAGLFILTHGLRGSLQRWRVTRHLAEIVSALQTVLVSRPSGAGIALVSIVVHLLTIAATWCTAQAIDAPFDITHALLLVPPVTLIAAIPVSIAGWGVREGAMVAAFAYAGLPQSDGLAVSVLFGAQMFAIGCAGGLVWLFTGGRSQLADARDGLSSGA